MEGLLKANGVINAVTSYPDWNKFCKYEFLYVNILGRRPLYKADHLVFTLFIKEMKQRLRLLNH